MGPNRSRIRSRLRIMFGNCKLQQIHVLVGVGKHESHLGGGLARLKLHRLGQEAATGAASCAAVLTLPLQLH